MLAIKYIDFLFYFLLVYFLYSQVLPRNYYSVPYSKPLWHKNINQPFYSLPTKEDIEADFKRNFYLYKNNLLFYDQRGDVIHKVKLDENSKASASVKNYIIFDESTDKLILFNLNGSILWALDSSSYPTLSPSGNRFALLHPNGMAFSIYNAERQQMVPLTQLSSMILDLNFCPFNDFFAIATADGEMRLIGYQGEEIFRVKFEDSQYNYIKSVKSSINGLYYLILTGLNPEYLVLLKNNGKELWRQKTAIGRRKHVSLFIDTVNRQILEPVQGDIYVRDLKEGNISYILDLKDMGIFDIRYIVASFIKGKMLIGVNGYEYNCVLLLNKVGKILWKRIHHDKHLLHVGFSEDKEKMIIHSSENIFTYRVGEF